MSQRKNVEFFGDIRTISDFVSVLHDPRAVLDTCKIMTRSEFDLRTEDTLQELSQCANIQL